MAHIRLPYAAVDIRSCQPIRAAVGFWPDHATARRDIENWIKFYNERRLHSALGYQTPVESRTAWQRRMTTAA